MRDFPCTVTADWDPEASVWVAGSDDIPGLVAEAATVEGLLTKLEILVPDLLRLNKHLLDGQPPQVIEMPRVVLNPERKLKVA